MEKFQTNETRSVERTDSSMQFIHELASPVVPTEKSAAKLPVNKEPPERIIEIANVHNTIGIWHQAQYEKMGVERLRLSANKVTLELKQPKEETEFFTTVGFGKTFTFNFVCSGNDWVMSNVQGLKVDNKQIVGMETSARSIKFLYDRGQREYSRPVENYIRALFDPLMNCSPKK